VITGLSGSGKSSLAFDTVYAEGQRRYVESLSAYARQFLGRMEKPDVDLIEGLSPAISIDQKGVSKNPRSTVGTITEIYDYLRLLFSRIGKPHCPSCGDPVSKQTNQEIVDRITRLPENKKIMLLAPIVKHMKGEHKNLIDKIKKDRFIFSSKSLTSLSSLILEHPSFLILSIRFLCSPFICLTMGASNMIFLFSGSLVILSTISWFVCFDTGSPQEGQCGFPILENNNRK
jgi:hypothetical protein